MGLSLIKMSLTRNLPGSIEPFMVFNYAEVVSRPDYVSQTPDSYWLLTIDQIRGGGGGVHGCSCLPGHTHAPPGMGVLFSTVLPWACGLSQNS